MVRLKRSLFTQKAVVKFLQVAAIFAKSVSISRAINLSSWVRISVRSVYVSQRHIAMLVRFAKWFSGSPQTLSYNVTSDIIVILFEVPFNPTYSLIVQINTEIPTLFV